MDDRLHRVAMEIITQITEEQLIYHMQQYSDETLFDQYLTAIEEITNCDIRRLRNEVSRSVLNIESLKRKLTEMEQAAKEVEAAREGGAQ